MKTQAPQASGHLVRRVVEPLIADRLRTHGGVLIEGPKAVGKTTTARQFSASEVRFDRDQAMLTAARVEPHNVLDGPRPRLLDEYQLAPELWNAVRGRIDDLGEKGLYLLTGSSTPADEPERHTGAGRIATVNMRTLTFQERGLSSGSASVKGLLAGLAPDPDEPRMTLSEVVEAMCIGGWPGNRDLGVADALDATAEYLDLVARVDLPRLESIRRDPQGVMQLITGYARNTATAASLKSLATGSDRPSESSVHAYVAALRRLLLIEDQPAWAARLRSRVRLAQTPKRHLTDPSLAIAALDSTPDRLLGPEIALLGFLFESQVVHDLRVYADVSRAKVLYYRDNKGLEADAVVEARDGRWLGVEVKLGHAYVESAASNLLDMRGKLDPAAQAQCGGLVVVTPRAPTYLRADGVIVTSIASLGV